MIPKLKPRPTPSPSYVRQSCEDSRLVVCEMVAIEIDTDDLENIIGTLTDAITNLAEKVSGLTDLLENMEDERECVSNAVSDLQTDRVPTRLYR